MAPQQTQSNLYQRVDEALEKMRPYLKADGGDVEIAEITDDKVVKLRLLGNCEPCPISYVTLRAGLEEAVKDAIPEIQKVEAINTTVE